MNTLGRFHSSVPAPFTWRRRLARLAVVALAVYGGVLLLAMAFEDRLIFFPSPYPEGDWSPPGLPVEDAHFQAADGTRLHGWFLPHQQSRAAVLVAHGNAGNITGRTYLLELLHRQRASTLVFDYRGFGKSQGSPSEPGILADARAARQWLAERTGTPPDKVVLLGESLGGGVVVDLAAADGAGGLILLSTFTSLPDVAASAMPWLPARLLMRTRLDSLSKIGRFPGPVLQAHAAKDEIVPLALAQRLFAAVSDPHKQFVLFPGGGHNDLPPRSFEIAVGQLLERTSGEGAN